MIGVICQSDLILWKNLDDTTTEESDFSSTFDRVD
jgi:hypothetical protein